MSSDHLVTDVVIVGAGPAGVSAGIQLVRAGRDVVIIDKATFPRDKICGDGLTTAALRELEDLGLEPASVESWTAVDDVIVRSPSGHTVTFALPRDAGQYAAIATRLDLDSALVDRARKEGVVVVEGASLETLDDRNDGVTVHTSRGGFNARYVVAADGMWSPTRKALGLATPGYLGEWHAFRQYFSNVTGPASSHLVVSFEADLLPGYFWAFPLPDGRANVGFGIERGRKHRTRDMKQLWPDLLARPHLRELLGPDATPEGMHRAWPIPAQLSKVPSGTGRVLFVGDALSACDPMTGEGIGQALESGRLAAAALDGRWDRPVSVQEQYRELLSATLAADQRMSNLLMRALAHRKGVRSSVRLAGSTAWTRRNFVRWLFEDEPRGIAFTPRRWHRGLLSRPGAFVERT